MKNRNSSRKRLWAFGAVFLMGVPAAAFYGGGFRTNGYVGPLPATYYADEPCFPSSISSYTEGGLVEVLVNPRGVAEDADPDTYLRCSDFANATRVICHAGFADGTIATCSDFAGPRTLPGLDDRVYMVIDPAQSNTPGADNCDIVVESSFGEANPACRAPAATGGSSGTGGSGSGACNASTAAFVVNSGEPRTIASNACVQLRVNATWSTVNPVLQVREATSVYPVPFSYTSCAGNGNSSFTTDWDQRYLIDNSSNTSANFGCDIFVQFQGNGSALDFVYYN